ncbi:MAG TPA: hypothetical protein VNE82_16655 [Candidatus Binataceae bacterium]|nr:hypothetical protein [Candidatus Binataceae bacterium]
MLLSVKIKEKAGERQDVPGPFTQRLEINPRDIEAVEQILRNRPRRTASSGSMLVAAMSRTSTGVRLRAPTRTTSRSCSTRSSLTCSDNGRSPTSSRKMLPPFATSNHLPARRWRP